MTRGVAVEVIIGALDQVPRRLSVDVVRTGSNGAQTLPENVSGIHGTRSPRHRAASFLAVLSAMDRRLLQLLGTASTPRARHYERLVVATLDRLQTAPERSQPGTLLAKGRTADEDEKSKTRYQPIGSGAGFMARVTRGRRSRRLLGRRQYEHG
ncbi:hypothetical protein CCMA1212_002588 [Trichoderma ghanense]|uniref:Uncharacterized protein n=1 Tax=Trichoderma ghanense TaxID=65468 RepID=A0ABY2HAJ4_9HYPO